MEVRSPKLASSEDRTGARAPSASYCSTEGVAPLHTAPPVPATAPPVPAKSIRRNVKLCWKLELWTFSFGKRDELKGRYWQRIISLFFKRKRNPIRRQDVSEDKNWHRTKNKKDLRKTRHSSVLLFASLSHSRESIFEERMEEGLWTVTVKQRLTTFNNGGTELDNNLSR